MPLRSCFLAAFAALLALTPAASAQVVSLPVTFEEAIDYELKAFEGAVAQLIVDPTDATNTVAEFVRPAGAGGFAGTTVADASGFTEPIPFASGATTMSVRVWSPAAGVPVRLKVEKFDDPTVSVEADRATTVAGEWETLVFDFVADKVPGTADINFASEYTKASIFFNVGQEGATEATTYYWDDLEFGGEGTPPVGGIALPVTFEEEIDYELRDFEGTATTIVADPTDEANTVAQTVRGAGAATYAGTVVADINGLVSPIPFTASATTMSVRVWSPTADTPVRLKIEQVVGGAFSETESRTTVAGAWETMVFDFASPVAGSPPVNPAEAYDKVVIFFNFGLADSPAAQTYYWDDVAFDAATGSGITLPVTFEEEIDYELRDFEGTATTIVADPTDEANTVAQTVRGAGAATYAGTVVADINGLVSPIPFTASATTMSVRVWSPTADTPVRLKIEQVVGGAFSETESRTTVAGAWETMVFDFASPVAGSPPVNPAEAYDKVVIFFNFGLADSPAAQTYYWDDLAFGGEAVDPPGPVVSMPITFEEDIDYELTPFEGAAAQLVADPTDATNTVAEFVRPAGAGGFAGTTVADASGFTEPIPFASGATTMSVRVWSPAAGVPVRLKVEKFDDPTVSVEADRATTVAGEWETLVFDFVADKVPGTADINFASEYTKASIFFNVGQEGATAATTYYWDDLEFRVDTAAEGDLAAFAVAPVVSPNPTRGAATVAFDLASASEVTVEVFDALGRRVAVVFEGTLPMGPARIGVPTDRLAAGLAIVRVRTEAGVATARFSIVR